MKGQSKPWSPEDSPGFVCIVEEIGVPDSLKLLSAQSQPLLEATHDFFRKLRHPSNRSSPKGVDDTDEDLTNEGFSNDIIEMGTHEALMACDLEFALNWLDARVSEDPASALIIDVAVEAGCIYGLLKARSRLGRDVISNRGRLTHLAKVRKPARRDPAVEALIIQAGNNCRANGYANHEVTGVVRKFLKTKGIQRSPSAVRRALQANGVIPKRVIKKKKKRRL